MDHESSTSRAAAIEGLVLAEAVAYKLPRPIFMPDPELDKALRDEAKRATAPRSTDAYFHPHTFGKWCRRREVYRIVALEMGISLPSPSPAPAALRLFEAGHACHDRIRDFSLSHMLYGYWECRKCGHTHGFTRDADNKVVHERLMFRPTVCHACQYEPTLNSPNEQYQFHYAEFEIVSESARIKGHCDGIILWRGKLRVLEIKSEDPQMYVERAGPTLGNGMQGAAYAFCINSNYAEDLRRDFPEDQNGVSTIMVVYVNKSSYRCDKSYIMKAGPLWQWIKTETELVRSIVDEVRPRVATMEELVALEHDAHFNHRCPRACNHRDVTMAKQCHSRKSCFASTFKR